MINKGETIIVQTHDTYMIAAELYDQEGAEKVDAFQHLTKEPICYLFNNPLQLFIITEPLRTKHFMWIERLKSPVYVKLRSSITHEQMTGEKTVMAYYLKTSVHYQSAGNLGLLRAIALPKIDAKTIDETLQTLYQTYQHKTQTIYATDDIKPTYETISIIDFTQSKPNILRQGDASLDDFPIIK